jgi:hypothetical protein
MNGHFEKRDLYYFLPFYMVNQRLRDTSVAPWRKHNNRTNGVSKDFNKLVDDKPLTTISVRS